MDGQRPLQAEDGPPGRIVSDSEKPPRRLVSASRFVTAFVVIRESRPVRLACPSLRVSPHAASNTASARYPTGTLSMPRGNPSPKLAITIDPGVHKNILAAAAREGVSVSAWMTTAAPEALRRRAG
jgi:hypothetical protein